MEYGIGILRAVLYSIKYPKKPKYWNIYCIPIVFRPPPVASGAAMNEKQVRIRQHLTFIVAKKYDLLYGIRCWKTISIIPSSHDGARVKVQ
jgi:hypothetical protein